MEKGRILTGARCRFSLNGKKVGYATQVTLGETDQHEAAEVLDNIEVEEYVPVGYRVNFACRLLRIVKETLKSQGYFPSVGQNSDEHLLNILNTGLLTGTLEDPKTGTIYATVEQVKIEAKTVTVDARGLIGKDVTFNAVRVRDESEI